MGRSGNPSAFLTTAERVAVESAVREAERRTSAEIKIVLVRHCWGDLRDKAEAVFRKHGLDRTDERNAVLVLLVLANREFVIYGGNGIHEKAGEGFWVDVREVMTGEFLENRFAEGLRAGVRRIGEKLAEHFPRRADDVNEVSDDMPVED